MFVSNPFVSLRRLVSVATLCLLSISGVAAQSDDFNRIEAFGIFSIQKSSGKLYDTVDILLDDVGATKTFPRTGLGYGGGFTVNFHRFVGAKFDGSYNRVKVSEAGESLTWTETTFMGGVQIKDNKVEGSRIRPFGHVLFGNSKYNLKMSPDLADAVADEFGTVRTGHNAFTMAIGGGVDIKATDRLSIRAIQVDYKPAFLDKDDFGDFRKINNLRISFGLVIH